MDTAYIVHAVTGEMYVIKRVHHTVMGEYVTRTTACVYTVVFLESLVIDVETIAVMDAKIKHVNNKMEYALVVVWRIGQGTDVTVRLLL